MDITAVYYVLVPVIFAIISNILLFTLRDPIVSSTQKRNPYLPPGWVIGIVWIILFGLLGYAAYLVKDNPYLVTFIAIIIIYCLAYPAITNLDPTSVTTRILNAGAFILASILIGVLTNNTAIYFAVPFWIWSAYVIIVDIVHSHKKSV